MTVRIGAIMVLKTVMTLIIFSPGEDGQSMLLVNHAAAIRMGTENAFMPGQTDKIRVVLDTIRNQGIQ